MLPHDLKAEQFSGYPPEARKLAVSNIETLRQLPLSFLPNLLREVIEYDFKFPAERAEVSRELAAAEFSFACTTERVVSKLLSISALVKAREL